MKNTLRYLLIAAIFVIASELSAANAAAQNLAQQPQVEMRSTSAMPSSGSSLPQAAVVGTSTTYGAPGASYAPGGPRRAASGEDGGDTPPGDPHGPNEDPIGDALLPLLLFACAYVGIRAFRRKRAQC